MKYFDEEGKSLIAKMWLRNKAGVSISSRMDVRVENIPKAVEYFKRDSDVFFIQVYVERLEVVKRFKHISVFKDNIITWSRMQEGGFGPMWTRKDSVGYNDCPFLISVEEKVKEAEEQDNLYSKSLIEKTMEELVSLDEIGSSREPN